MATMSTAQSQNHDFDVLLVKLEQPIQVISWSFNEVKKPKTINYPTFQPERNSQFNTKVIAPKSGKNGIKKPTILF